MRISPISAVAGTLLVTLAAASSSAAAGFDPAGVTPAVVTKPGKVEFRYTLTGGDQLQAHSFTVRSGQVPASAFGDDVDALAIQDVKAEGGTLSVLSIASASVVPSCRRGGDLQTEFKKYRIDVPAAATVTVTVTAEVPAGLPGSAQPSLRLEYGNVSVDGQPVTTELNVAEQTVKRTAQVDGVALRIKPARNGRFTLSGRVQPGRAGEKVTFVSRKPTPATPEGVDAAFGTADSLLRPKAGLRVVGSAKTTKGGKYSATLGLTEGSAVAARTSGAHAGASCGVLVPLVPQAG